MWVIFIYNSTGSSVPNIVGSYHRLACIWASTFVSVLVQIELNVLIPLLVASSNSCVSTCSAGSCTYRTTDPRMKQFFTAICNVNNGQMMSIMS